MVSGSRIEGGPQILSAGVRKTIQSIKEIVGNHSDADIYVALKETNMDPNETTQKLLNQDPFHEVKRKRDKKKEVTGYKGSTGLEPRKATGNVGGQGMRVGKIDSDQNVRRGGYARNTIPGTGVSREFRVVRDNRANQNSIRELKTPSASKTEPVILNVSENRGRSSNSNQKQPLVRASMSSNGAAYRQARNNYSSSGSKDILEEERQPPSVPNAGETNNDSSTSLNSSGGIVVGVYSSSSDPVHVPSLDSRPAANKREVGVVGVRRHFPKNNLSSHNASSSHPHLGPAREPLAAASENDQPPQTTTSSATVSVVAAAAMPNMPSGRPFVNNHHHHHHQHSSSNRSQQQVVAHHKGSQPNKEWKPKSSQKPNVNGPGVIGAPAKSVSDNPKEKAVAELQEKVSRVKISENQNVIIASHIRVSETDRSRLTFGTLGAEFNPLQQGSELQEVGGAPESIEPSASISISAPESSSEETSVGSKQGDSIDEHGRNSGSNSPASENQLADRKVSSPSPQNLGSYADIGLVHDDTASYAPSESQHQQQDPPELPTFSAYDPQSGYDIRYFRPIIDETVRAQGVLSPQEDLSSHMVNSMPASTIAMVQQQQQQVAQVAQMYPQVHFANIMPYRQYMSPVYVPSPGMAMAAGYSSNPAAAGAYSHHPSNASSGYVLMPSPGAGGGTSPHPHHHLTAKYGIQQFKPLPTGSPTGFAANFTGGGYGVVGGIEDSSRIKYKDGNLYIGGQAETSEIWMNPRDLPSLQSAAAAAAAASYYNMAGQVPPPHAAATATYLPSHTAHHAAASFNAVAQQSSHMQFPGGLYHSPQQAAAIASPHHMGGNVAAAAAAPGAQLGAYQQPQLGHLSWTGNF